MKPRIDPAATPIEFRFSPPLAEVKLRVWLGLIVLAAVSVAIYFLRGDTFAVFVSLGFGLFGLLNLVYGILQSRFSMSMTISGSEVAFDATTLFGRRSFRERLNAYRGILLREEELADDGPGKTRFPKRYHIVELLHADASKTLPLHVCEGGAPPRDIQQAFARRFNLPPLVPDVFASGTIAAGLGVPAPDPGPPPPGVIVREVNGITYLTIERGWKGKIAGFLLWLFLPVAAGGLVYQIDPASAPLAAAMVAGLVLLLLGIGGLMNRKRDKFPLGVCIGAGDLWIGNPESPSRMSIPLSAIEQVTVDRQRAYVSESARSCVRLVVEGGGRRLEFLRGQIDRMRVEWVRNQLLYWLSKRG
jgi:hypothetical protein